MSIAITSEVIERFWNKVTKSPKCWEWSACRSSAGYGQMRSRGVTYYAHRLSWQIAFGDTGLEKHVLHHCDNPPCVRPDHLFLGTPKDNSVDMRNKGRARGKRSRGEANGFAKLTESQVLEIRGRYESGERQASLAREFQVTQANISIIVTGQGWRHLGDDRRAFMSLIPQVADR